MLFLLKMGFGLLETADVRPWSDMTILSRFGTKDSELEGTKVVLRGWEPEESHYVLNKEIYDGGR